MKIAAGCRIDAQCRMHLLRRRWVSEGFPDLNAMREALSRRAEFPTGDLTDFGRGAPAARAMMLAALGLAADRGSALPPEIGIVGWNGAGCVADHLRFWRDYTDNGRETGRGGLFVATLPTTPFCEAAITLGCRGRVTYCRTAPGTGNLLTLAAADRPTLAGEVAGGSACLVLLEPEAAEYPEFPTLAELFQHLEVGS